MITRGMFATGNLPESDPAAWNSKKSTRWRVLIASPALHLATARLIDEAIIVVAWLGVLAYARFGLRFGVEDLFPAVIAALVFGYFAQGSGLYYAWHPDSPFQKIGKLLACWLGASGLLVLGAWFGLVPAVALPVEMAAAWVATAFLALVGVRAGRRVLVRGLVANKQAVRRFAVVGCNSLARRLCASIEARPWLGLQFVGYYDDRRGARIPLGAAVRGDFAKLREDVQGGAIDCVYIVLPMQAEKRINQLAADLADSTVSLFYVPDFSAFNLLHARWEELDGLPVVSIYDTPLRGANAVLKRITDVVLANLILLLTAPIMAAIAVAIKLTSPGPVLFRQRRYGLGGEEIRVWKFRTMYVCEDGDRIEQAKRHDARVTRLGAWLRRTSLDELPQFFNVLKGEMSIVGPRPHAVAHNQYYRKLIPGYMLRHKVKPGITGLAQVMGYRGETDSLEKMAMRVHYDLEYIRSWSWWLDIKLILWTVYEVAKGFVTKQVF